MLGGSSPGPQGFDLTASFCKLSLAQSTFAQTGHHQWADLLRSVIKLFKLGRFINVKFLDVFCPQSRLSSKSQVLKVVSSTSLSSKLSVLNVPEGFHLSAFSHFASLTLIVGTCDFQVVAHYWSFQWTDMEFNFSADPFVALVWVSTYFVIGFAQPSSFKRWWLTMFNVLNALQWLHATDQKC